MYWTNILNVTLPADRNIVLADILECGVTDRDKSFCVDANYNKAGNLERYFTKSRRQLVFGVDKHEVKILQLPHGANNGGLRCQNGKVPSMTSSSWQSNNFLFQLLKSGQAYYRKLTPVECERLQTVPDNYTAHVSNAQRYKMLGNGWTVDVVAHILRSIQ